MDWILVSFYKQTRSREDLLQVIEERGEPVLLRRGPETSWHREQKQTVTSTFGNSGSLGKHKKMCFNFILLWPSVLLAWEGIGVAELLLPHSCWPSKVSPLPGEHLIGPGSRVLHPHCPETSSLAAPLPLLSTSLIFSYEQRLFWEDFP